MPVSRSLKRAAEPPARSRSYWPLILVGLAAVLAVIITALPASIIAHFLPPTVQAEDFSGSLWHGSAGKVSVNARDAGAFEWQLHPKDLFGMTVAANLRWVKQGFMLTGAVRLDGHGIAARDIKGGGPIEDLRDLGVAAGWRGSADVNFSELKTDFARLLAAAGEIRVSNLTSAQLADGADLGGYELRLADGAVDADGNVSTQLMDTGGPLDVQAIIRYSAKERTGVLSGTIMERPGAPAALHGQLESLSQLRGRNPQGRIPVDLEFNF